MAPTIRRLQDRDVPQVADVLDACFGEIERWDEEPAIASDMPSSVVSTRARAYTGA